MSLITCCPSCGTKFRVVADQLRISEGWVRCGRCQEVFDATQALEEMPLTTAPMSASTVQPALQEQAVTQPPIVRGGDSPVVEASQPSTSHPLVNTLPEAEAEA
ncbi:zinc-ribbon domain-containing protein, partial [Comamonas sp. UBA7840]